LSQAGLVVAKGQFGAMMSIEAVNDGPICILLDSKRAM
jgi:D-Tyr-tRNAtyr deacylase